MNKTLKAILISTVSVILLAGTFSAGFLVGHFIPFGGQNPSFNDLVPFAPPTVSPEQQTATPADVQELFKPFWQTWNLVHDQYVIQPVDDVKLMEGAINGMLQTLDVGLNYYENADTYAQTSDYLNGKDYEGIGAYVDITGDYMTIISPMRGSPAEEAGLRAGDKVIAIDGEDMTGVSPEAVRQKVLGPDGTTIVITILREGEDRPFDVSITRAKITTPLVESEMRSDGIGYVRLNTFGDSADSELRTAIEELLSQNPKGLILDLRYNGGGYLDQGIAVASEFLPKDKVIVYEKSGDGRLEENMSLGNGVALDIPMVVLVNEGSASASEIVAGALQDYGRAKLVGITSYGKGSVQSVNQLGDGSIVAITSAQWLTPNQRLIQDVGLTPDVYVEYTEADFDAKRDPQLDAAVETLMAIVDGTPIPTSMPMPTSTSVP